MPGVERRAPGHALRTCAAGLPLGPECAGALGWQVTEYARTLPLCRAVYLHVITSNEPAIAFYRRLSFQCVRCLPQFYYIHGDCAPVPDQVPSPHKAGHRDTETRRHSERCKLVLSERSSLSPGKGLHHQRSSRHAMVPLSDTSPHPGG